MRNAVNFGAVPPLESMFNFGAAMLRMRRITARITARVSRTDSAMNLETAVGLAVTQQMKCAVVMNCSTHAACPAVPSGQLRFPG